jgi:hypothetical protein
MKRQYRSRDDDDDIVRDGQVVRLPMTMMDGMDPIQKAVARASLRVTDGGGKGGLNLHRPGFRLSDARQTSDAAIARAYELYDAELTSAWKGSRHGDDHD